MSTDLRLKRIRRFGMSYLEISTAKLDIELKLLSRMDRRERRAILRAFFQQIRPWLQNLDLNRDPRAQLDHVGTGVIRSARARRGLTPFRVAPMSSEDGAFGYEIRMRRLELGWSQADLARRVGIRRSHLSDLERGIHHARRETLQQLVNALYEERPIESVFPTVQSERQRSR